MCLEYVSVEGLAYRKSEHFEPYKSITHWMKKHICTWTKYHSIKIMVGHTKGIENPFLLFIKVLKIVKILTWMTNRWVDRRTQRLIDGPFLNCIKHTIYSNSRGLNYNINIKIKIIYIETDLIFLRPKYQIRFRYTYTKYSLIYKTIVEWLQNNYVHSNPSTKWHNLGLNSK